MRSGGDAGDCHPYLSAVRDRWYHGLGISIAVSIGGRRRCWTAGLDRGGRSTRDEGISGTRARDKLQDRPLRDSLA
jgi:hypothetical protein